MAGAADELRESEYHFSDNGLYNWGLYKGGDDISNLGELDEDEGDICNLGLDEGGDEFFLSNVAGPSDPVVPDNTSLLSSIEVPKHHAEEMEERGGRKRLCNI
jgi:hypothetical protein